MKVGEKLASSMINGQLVRQHQSLRHSVFFSPNIIHSVLLYKKNYRLGYCFKNWYISEHKYIRSLRSVLSTELQLTGGESTFLKLLWDLRWPWWLTISTNIFFRLNKDPDYIVTKQLEQKLAQQKCDKYICLLFLLRFQLHLSLCRQTRKQNKKKTTTKKRNTATNWYGVWIAGIKHLRLDHI